MKTSYRQKLFLYFLAIFTLSTIVIFFFEQTRERKHKTEALEEKLDAYADIVDAGLKQPYDGQHQMLDSLAALFPENIRLTLIDRQGLVLYDNILKETSRTTNHAHRPEILKAQETGTGSDIRVSSTNEKKYLYYAKQFNPYYVRVALPYDIRVRHFLRPDPFFLYFIVAVFVLILLVINWVASRFAHSVKQLRDFTSLIEKEEFSTPHSPFSILHSPFPQDELGETAAKIAENYLTLKAGKREIAREREKLLQHVHSSEEGICFFSANRSVEFYNGLFIQYLNTIIDAADSDPTTVLTDAAFEKVTSFVFNRKTKDTYFETQINKHGKDFAVRVNIFNDKSFEIIINDITRQEKTRRLKQDMTGNITHELRTPVTGIRGCLETVLEHPLTPEKKDYFIRNAYNQVLVLSELIQDMSLLTRIEDAPQSFRLEAVVIRDLLEDIKKDFQIPLQDKHIGMEWNIAGDVVVRGNRNLLYSIFRNLTDNVVRYAGNDIRIQVYKYNEDRNFYYFSYSDTGTGIPDEQHLSRLFERFYRVDKGRTRDMGGSGLGLSIVKNSIFFHKGTIVAKNRKGGGLEFLFKLPKVDEVFH
ncbi:MAG: two-component sensor histidine kinase [Tannerella sp.]|jgi:signal transduction histidine kinase|nr:two-component sensor histidine kinase [Tannerella sp.]